MASINERTDSKGNKTYQVKIRKKGFKTQSKTFTRLTDAKKWAQITEVAMIEGRLFPHEVEQKRTLSELIDRYIDEILPQKPKSYRDQKQQLNYWKNEIGDKPLSEITPSVISAQRNKLAKGSTNRGKRSNATVNRYLAVMSHVFTIAVKEWEWMRENPVSNVRRLKESRGRTRFLSDEERSRLLQACKESDNQYLYLIVVLALSTGARRNEILTLTWDRIDFERQVITLMETKNGEIRVIPLQGHALALVSDLARYNNIREGYLFPSDITDKPVDITKAWRNVLKRAQINDFRFHDLRHSAASYLAMNNASLTDIADVLGHKTLAMVKRYAHLSEAHTKNVVSQMNERIFGDD